MRLSGSGALTLANSMAASGIAGTTNLAAAGDELYNESGLSSTVDVFEVGSGGVLTLIQTVPVPDGASQEEIVAI
jgi:hypothetical protein